MSTSISDFSATGASFNADALSGPGPGSSEVQGSETSPGSSAFAQAFAQKMADLSSPREAPGVDTAATDEDTALRQEVAASGEVGQDPGFSADPAIVALQVAAALASLSTPTNRASAAGLPGEGGLTTVPVSPGLNVIQPAQPELDGQSLVAFARAQGLDDRAVQWLFGQDAKAASATPGAAGQALSTGLAPDLTASSTPVEANAGSTAADRLAGALPAATALADALTAVSAAVSPVASAVSSFSAGVAPMAVAGASALIQGALNVEGSASVAGALTVATAGPTANAMAAATAAASLAASVQVKSSQDPSQGTQVIQGGVDPQAAAALAWLREGGSKGASSWWGSAAGSSSTSGHAGPTPPTDPLLAALQVSKQSLSQVGRSSNSAPTNPRASNAPSRPANGTLDLSSLDPELLEWIETRAAAGSAGRQRGPWAGSAGTAGAAHFEGGAARVLAQWARADAAGVPAESLTPVSSPATPLAAGGASHAAAAQAVLKAGLASQEAGLAQAQDRAQRLSDRLGEAVGQRMLTELEKGNWHLNLKLRPESLGSIEIEMRMNAGQLNAQFTAHQALTRDLLSDGIQRLRDTLAQMGMNVAQMNVNGGRSQQRGGDSTPRQSQGVQAPEATSNNQEADAKNPSRISALRSGSAWDMLV